MYIRYNTTIPIFDSDTKTTAERQEYDLSSYELTHALNIRFDPNSTVPIERLINETMLEKDLHGSLEIWQAGFLEVLASLNEVIGRLSQ